MKKLYEFYVNIIVKSLSIIFIMFSMVVILCSLSKFCHGATAAAPDDDVFYLQRYRSALRETLVPHGMDYKDLRYAPPLLSYVLVSVVPDKKVDMDKALLLIIRLHTLVYPMLILAEDENEPDEMVLFTRVFRHPQPHQQLFVRQATQPPVVLPDVALEKSLSTDSIESLPEGKSNR